MKRHRRFNSSYLIAQLRADAPAWRDQCAERCRRLATDPSRRPQPTASDLTVVDPHEPPLEHPMRFALSRVAGVLAAAVLLTAMLRMSPEPHGPPTAWRDGAPRPAETAAFDDLDPAIWLERPWSELESVYLGEARRLRADAEAGARLIWRQMPQPNPPR